MASISGGAQNMNGSNYNPKANYTGPLMLMISLYFMIGFITVMNDVLIPSLKGLFKFGPTDTAKVMLIQFCFFIAYAVMSIPAGIIIKKIGYKKGLALALSIMGVGLLLFVPASIVISYAFFLFALFVVAIGLAILQVAINPYITALGAPETASSRMNLGGAMNSFATFTGPIIGAAFILKEGITDPIAKAEAVRGPYILLALLTFAIAAILYFIKLPKIASQEEETGETESIFKFRHLLYGSGAIFFYVGAEVAIGSLLILYLKSDFGINERSASSLVAYYWGSSMIGRLIGSALGQKIKSETMLTAVTLIAFVLVSCSMLGVFSAMKIDIPVMVMNTEHGVSFNFPMVNVPLAAFLLVLVGLFNSVMWPCIFPLGINKLGTATSNGSGLMVTMVAGGAFIPLLQGMLADNIGYRYSFIVCLACYAYILFFALKGYKTDYLEKKTISKNDTLQDVLNQPIKPSSNGKVLDSILK
ncbi:MAG TPA: sugar MFS transporter [Cytophagaceae bacterium]|jgi:FHS family L-fucose permease-like MFS transporter|nr:sugar MFS transporter [Cytophagaceae bacterium]